MTYVAPAAPDLSSALGTAQTNIVGYITSALPYALGVLGITVGIPVGIKLFRRFAK